MAEAAQQDSIRRRLAQSNDPRAARVRSQLFAAAHRLECASHPVSVSTLTKEAGVSRSVFYAHFADIADFVLQMQREHIDALASAFRDTDTADLREAGLAGQLAFVSYFSDHRETYRAVMSLAGEGVVTGGIAAVIKDAIASHIRRFARLPEGLSEEAAATYISGGIAHLIAGWLLDPDPIDEASLAQCLTDLMPGWLYAD